MSKKEKSKKDKKKGGKKSKADKAKLKAPSKKLVQKKAKKLDKATLKSSGKKIKKPKFKLKGMRASREPQDVDFTTVMVTESFRRRVCDGLNLSPRERGYLTKTIHSITRTASLVQREPASHSDSHLTASRLGEIGAIDLDTLMHVVTDISTQDDIRRLMGRSASIGAESIRLLRDFVVIAEQVVRDERAASSS
jgi:hypothetical protein